jgi:hypothetical protein
MMNVKNVKTLLEIDEWVSSRQGFSYSMSVNSWGVSFFVYCHETDEGMHVQEVSDIDEDKIKKVRSEQLCET